MKVARAVDGPLLVVATAFVGYTGLIRRSRTLSLLLPFVGKATSLNSHTRKEGAAVVEACDSQSGVEAVRTSLPVVLYLS